MTDEDNRCMTCYADRNIPLVSQIVILIVRVEPKEMSDLLIYILVPISVVIVVIVILYICCPCRRRRNTNGNTLRGQSVLSPSISVLRRF